MATERMAVAKEAYSRALKLNPFLFEAFENVVKMGFSNGNNKENKENPGEFIERVFQVGHYFFVAMTTGKLIFFYFHRPPISMTTRCH